MTIELDEDISVKGGKSLKYTSAYSGGSYAISSSQIQGTRSTLGSFIYIDDFERYTSTTQMQLFWLQSTSDIKMYLANENYPSLSGQSLSDYNAISFFAKGHPDYSMLIFFKDFHSVSSHTISVKGFEEKWKKFEYTISWGSCDSTDLKHIQLHFTGSSILGESLYLDEMVLFDIKSSDENSKWIKVNVTGIKENFSNFVNEEQIAGYYGNVLNKTDVNEGSLDLSIFSPSRNTWKDFNYLSNKLEDYENLLLRIPGDCFSVFISSLKKTPQYSAFEESNKIDITMMEDTFRAKGLSGIYYKDTDFNSNLFTVIVEPYTPMGANMFEWPLRVTNVNWSTAQNADQGTPVIFSDPWYATAEAVYEGGVYTITRVPITFDTTLFPSFYTVSSAYLSVLVDQRVPDLSFDDHGLRIMACHTGTHPSHPSDYYDYNLLHYVDVGFKDQIVVGWNNYPLTHPSGLYDIIKFGNYTSFMMKETWETWDVPDQAFRVSMSDAMLYLSMEPVW